MKNSGITAQYKALDDAYYMPAFSRSMAIVRGKGSTVWDGEGKEYLDLVAGIAVCSTGHCNPTVVAAICEQAHKLIHCSNLYYVPHQGEMAKKIVEITGMLGLLDIIQVAFGVKSIIHSGFKPSVGFYGNKDRVELASYTCR